MKEIPGKALVIGTGIVVSGGMLILGVRSCVNQQERTSSSDQSSVPAESYDYEYPQDETTGESTSAPEENEWDCAPIPKGSWLTQELRVRGAPGIDPGPYKIIHSDGSVQKFETYDELPNLVYPGEEFCIKKIEPHSFNIKPAESHGVVFESSIKHQNNLLAQRSLNIHASIRAKQGF